MIRFFEMTSNRYQTSRLGYPAFLLTCLVKRANGGVLVVVLADVTSHGFIL
jgi:hypothetical protein